jgi:hypothetical protein
VQSEIFCEMHVLTERIRKLLRVSFVRGERRVSASRRDLWVGWGGDFVGCIDHDLVIDIMLGGGEGVIHRFGRGE